MEKERCPIMESDAQNWEAEFDPGLERGLGLFEKLPACRLQGDAGGGVSPPASGGDRPAGLSVAG